MRERPAAISDRRAEMVEAVARIVASAAVRRLRGEAIERGNTRLNHICPPGERDRDRAKK